MFDLLCCTLLLAAQAVDGGPAPEAAAPVAAQVADVSETAGKPADADKDAEQAKDKEMGRRAGPVSPASLKEGVRRAREKPARPSDAETALRQKKETEELVVRLEAAREKMQAEAERLEVLIKEWDRRHAEGCPVDEGTPPATAPRGAATRPAAGPRSTPDVESLAKSLKSMKPKQAANVVERLDRTTAARALKKMSPRSAGGVLAAMSPNAAAEVADAMTQLRETP